MSTTRVRSPDRSTSPRHARDRDRTAGARSRPADGCDVRRWRPVGLCRSDSQAARLHRHRVDGWWLQRLEGRRKALDSPALARAGGTQPLSASPSLARGGGGGATRPARRQGAPAWRRRPGLTRCAVPRRRRGRHARHHRHGRSRRIEPAASDHPPSRTGRRAQGRISPGIDCGAEPLHHRQHLRHAPERRQCARRNRRLRRHHRRRRQLPVATSSTTPR